jgi:uncharacterized SAM-binding protein YcdF (DUF218 family)
MILDFLKQHLHASSPLTMGLLLSIAVAGLFAQPSARWPRRFLLTVMVAYWLMATRTGSTLLVAGLSQGFSALESREAARGADAVVVLGGGAATFQGGGQVVGILTMSSILRALEGARVAKLIGARLVVASGGEPRPDLVQKPESEMLGAVLMAAGVPADRIVEESSSKTTREQARLIPTLLRERGIDRFVLVTSPVHMGRSLALFRAQGIDPVPSVSPMRSEHLPAPSFIVPEQSTLAVSDEALYDYMAWIYYWWKGWLRGQAASQARSPAVSVGPENPGPPAATYPWLAPLIEALTQNA